MYHKVLIIRFYVPLLIFNSVYLILFTGVLIDAVLSNVFYPIAYLLYLRGFLLEMNILSILLIALVNLDILISGALEREIKIDIIILLLSIFASIYLFLLGVVLLGAIHVIAVFLFLSTLYTIAAELRDPYLQLGVIFLSPSVLLATFDLTFIILVLAVFLWLLREVLISKELRSICEFQVAYLIICVLLVARATFSYLLGYPIDFILLSYLMVRFSPTIIAVVGATISIVRLGKVIATNSTISKNGPHNQKVVIAYNL